VKGIEPSFHPWQGCVIATIRHSPSPATTERAPAGRPASPHDEVQRILLLPQPKITGNKMCRGGESNTRHEALQATALPLSYRGATFLRILILKEISASASGGHPYFCFACPPKAGTLACCQIGIWTNKVWALRESNPRPTRCKRVALTN
jgi:hypothetical protein